MEISRELKDKLKKIELLVMDVDGTLTDGAMYYSSEGEELKRFSTRDGMGITLLRKAGIKSAIITSENSEIALARAKKLKIDIVKLGSHDKSSSIKEIAEKLSLKLENVAYIGDDINDYHVMKLCGASACPGDSTAAIKQAADYICRNNGGNGAVREFSEMILISKDKSVILSENW